MTTANFRTTMLLGLTAVAGAMLSCKDDKSSDNPTSHSKYAHKAKQSEFKVNLRTIAEGAAQYYSAEHGDGGLGAVSHRLPNSVGQSPPGAITCDKKSPSDVNWDVWAPFHFTIDKPFYGHYSFTVGEDGQSFTATAKYDLDCDQQIGEFQLTGQVQDGRLVLGDVKETAAD